MLECAEAFTRLREALTITCILFHCSPLVGIAIHTVSGYGLGAVLVQTPSTGGQQVVAAGCCLCQSHVYVTRGQLLGHGVRVNVWAVTKLRPYLYGQFLKIITDRHALCWLSATNNLSGRLGGWILRLREGDIVVVYKSRRKHNDADSLSHCLLPDEKQTPLFTGPITALSSDCVANSQRADIWTRLDGSCPSRSCRFTCRTQHF